jgi:uncharacterized protein (DUF1684 family)
MSTTTPLTAAELDLLDWRRAVFDLYARVRADADPAAAWRAWRRGRDALFARHPQTPLEADAVPGFAGLPCFPYDPALRVTARVQPEPPSPRTLRVSTGEPVAGHRFGLAWFRLGEAPLALPVYWLDGYGGGLFLPFADATNGESTYGAGRYLLDTIKGADLGGDGDALVLDFNFAYNPSCAYRSSWTCPLPAGESRLSVPVEAGERAEPSP